MIDYPHTTDSSSSYQEVPDSALYSHEAEYALIGSMIQHPDLIDDAGGKLSVGDFHHPACAELFE
ncbi:DnaB-like helicase N-terminal domain-containing protein, partial [Klebsiella variicola]|uniref:DnaB-like helicase N-terminal domain-containing protein n=2 Tax=Gammaproteobacteria TaxID=1236 RepID=UPI00272F5F54